MRSRFQRKIPSKKYFLPMVELFYDLRMPIVLESFRLAEAERALCEHALKKGGNIVEAATLLGITRHALKRRIVKHQIDWPQARPQAYTPTI